jgi:Cu+-exporting ATPase
MTIFSRKATDPVCGMTIDPEHSDLTACEQGQLYHFCAESCRRAFEADPRKYIDKPARKGWWDRYLERVKRATGGRPMSCH